MSHVDLNPEVMFRSTAYDSQVLQAHTIVNKARRKIDRLKAVSCDEFPWSKLQDQTSGVSVTEQQMHALCPCL